MLGMADPRVKQALAEWGQIAPNLGLDPSQFRSKLIWQKDEPTRSHIVVRLRGPRTLIMKRAFLRPAGDDTNLTIAALQDASSRLEPYPNAHAPEVLFTSATGDLVLMSEALGKTLDDHLRKGRAHSKMLKRTGAWLGAFHASSETEERTYQPSFMVRHCERLANEVEAGKIDVVDPEYFVSCCRMIRHKEKDASDQKTVSATKHGDFNLRNIMLGPNGETGIDFKPLSSAPVGFDIARILLDYAELFQPNADLKSGVILSGETLDAFFDGYDVVKRNDPGVTFLPFVQLLNDWRQIPTLPARRSWRQKARYEGITVLAQNGFGNT